MWRRSREKHALSPSRSHSAALVAPASPLRGPRRHNHPDFLNNQDVSAGSSGDVQSGLSRPLLSTGDSAVRVGRRVCSSRCDVMAPSIPIADYSIRIAPRGIAPGQETTWCVAAEVNRVPQEVP